jgi:hypothetical protein
LKFKTSPLVASRQPLASQPKGEGSCFTPGGRRERVVLTSNNGQQGKATPTAEENEAATKQLVNSLSTYVPEKTTTKRLTPTDVNVVCVRLAKSKDISVPTATRAIALLVRKVKEQIMLMQRTLWQYKSV